MKRKVVGLLLALTLSLSVTACTNVAEVTSGAGETSKTESSAEKTQSETGSEKDDSGKGASGEENSGDGKADSGEKKESIKERVLFSGYYANVYYGVNEKGEKVSEYRWNEVCDALKERGIELNGYVEAMGDGLFFFRDTENFGSSYVHSVYAVDADVDNYWCVNVCTLDENWWTGGIDYYQGKLYVIEESGNHQIKESVYERSTDGTFVKVDNPNGAAIQSMQGYNLLLQSPNFGNMDTSCSITRVLDENGFVIGYKDGYVKIAKDGSVTALSGMPSDYRYNMRYDKMGAGYTEYDEDTMNYAIMGVNFQTGEKVTISALDSNEGKAILGYKDGKLYYYVYPEDTFVIRKNSIYEYDFATGKSRLLYTAETTPGATEYLPGISGFTIVSGDAYFIQLIGDQVKWVKRDLSASGSEAVDLGLSIQEKSLFHYGTIAYDTYEERCKGCGIPIVKYYGETFTLDKQYSPAADKINETLKKRLQEEIENYQKAGNERDYDTEECEYHKAYPTNYCETDEDEISSVTILQNKYLLVDYSGYWYGGGAHGMPHMDEHLFDLTTGEEKFLKDFYQGSEKDFKKLVATKTKEDFLSYSDSDGSPYFAATAEDAYKQAYDSVSLDSTTVLFDEDGIYYYYPPYEMGPYAAGYIYIEISYQELLGRPEL